jgi:hypothetical protein
VDKKVQTASLDILFKRCNWGTSGACSRSLRALGAQHKVTLLAGGSGGGGTFDSGNGRMDFAEWLESIVRIAYLRAKAGALGDAASMEEYVRRLMEEHRFGACKPCLNLYCKHCSSLASAFWV